MFLIFLVFYVVLLWFFTFLVPCCDVCNNLRINTMFDSSLPPVVHTPFLMGCMLLIFLPFCVVSFSSFVLVLCLLYSMLAVSLNYPFLIAPSVFSNVYCLFG